MNYNRYLDLHLCTSSEMAALRARYDPPCFLPGGRYFYEFSADIMRQMRYRESKDEGFTSVNNPNCKILDQVELTEESSAGFLQFTRGEITEELKQLRYVGCMVAIEHLKTKKVYPNLAALVRWISDPLTVNKLRINCHGSGTKKGGFSMGKVEMSPAEFVGALVRHGLNRPDTHAEAVVVYNARWKRDLEENACEDCELPFSFVRRRHHCRRCGGLFCDACSSKKLDLAVALTGENNATARNVKKARVCNACYNAVGTGGGVVADAIARERSRLAAGLPTETPGPKYGLQQITLALCMGAKTEEGFSPERDPNLVVGPQAAGTFIQDSLAHRVLKELRIHNLRGIRLAASNQVVVCTRTSGISNLCGIKYPSSSNAGVREKVFRAGTASFEVPAYIYGSSRALKAAYDAIPTRAGTARGKISDVIDVSPDGRSLFFSRWNEGDANQPIHAKTFYREWRFISWAAKIEQCYSLPGGRSTEATWKITAPDRVTQIALNRGAAGTGARTISVTGREEDSFKQYKSYEVS
jgi:hypothetical protein